MIRQELEQVFEYQKPKASLFTKSVTSGNLFDLFSPSQIPDFVGRDAFLKSELLAQALLNANIKPSKLRSLLRCGQVLGTPKSLLVSCGCGEVLRDITYHCSNRSCPKCAKRRQRKIFRKYYPLVRNLKSTSSYSLKFLTISPKNYDSLEEGYAHVRKSMRSLIHKSPYFKDFVHSGLYVIESKNMNKLGVSKGWNIHVHIILYSRYLSNKLYGHCFDCGCTRLLKYDKYFGRFYCSHRSCNSVNVVQDPDDSRLVRELKSVFKRDLVADVRLMRDRFSPNGYFRSSAHALNYCLKYVSSDKGDFASIDDFAKYIVFSSGRRLIQTFGAFYNHSNEHLKPVCPVCDQPLVFSMVNTDTYLDSLKPPEQPKTPV